MSKSNSQNNARGKSKGQSQKSSVYNLESTKNEFSASSKPAATKKSRKTKNEAISQINSDLFSSNNNIKLFDSFINAEISIETISNSWLKQYERDEHKALVELLNSILKCGGSKLAIKPQAFEHYDLKDIIEQLNQAIEDFEPEYIFNPRGKDKKNRKRVLEFFTEIISLLFQYSEVDKAVAVDNIFEFINPVTTSNIRSLRHVSISVSLNIITSLCIVNHESNKEKATLEKQLSLENKKVKRNSDKEADLINKIQSVNSQLFAGNNIIKAIFEKLFKRSFRDVDPSVRSESVSCMGTWVIKYPEYFLDGAYLRYVGWNLSDPVPSVRSDAVSIFLKLSNNKNLVSGLRSCLEYFQTRIVEMGLKDIDPTIRMNSIQLCGELLERGLMNDDNRNQLFALLYHTEEKVRKAAGKFVSNSLLNYIVPSEHHQLMGSEPEFENDEYVRLFYKTIINTIVTSHITESQPITSEYSPLYDVSKGFDQMFQSLHSKKDTTFALGVRALYPNLEILKNWELMTKYLTSESSHSSRKKSNRAVELTEDEEKHLLEIFATCCRIMKESYLSKVSSGKGAKDLNDDPYIKCRESFIQQDLGSWKQILAKYSHNHHSVIQVLAIFESLFDGETVITSRQTKSLIDVLNEIKKIINNTSNPSVIFQAIYTCYQLTQFGSVPPESITQFITVFAHDIVQKILATRHNLETLAVHLFRFRVVMMLTEWGHTLVFDSDSDQFINFLHECLQGLESDQSLIDSTISIHCCEILYRGVLSAAYAFTSQNSDNQASDIARDGSLVSSQELAKHRNRLLRNTVDIINQDIPKNNFGFFDLQKVCFSVISEILLITSGSETLRKEVIFPSEDTIESSVAKFLSQSLDLMDNLLRQQHESTDIEINSSAILADPLARQSFIHIVGICLRAIRLGHFSFGHLIGLLTRYPTFDPVIQELLKNMLMSSIKVFVLKSSNPAQVNHYIDSLGIALTSSFDKWQSREIECEFKFIAQLSRLIANSLRNVGSRLSWISEALIHFHETSSSKYLAKFKANIKNSSSDSYVSDLLYFKLLNNLITGLLAPNHLGKLIESTQKSFGEIKEKLKNEPKEMSDLAHYISLLEKAKGGFEVPSTIIQNDDNQDQSDISQIDIQASSTPSKSISTSHKRKAGELPSSLQKLVEEGEDIESGKQRANASPSSSKKSKRN